MSTLLSGDQSAAQSNTGNKPSFARYVISMLFHVLGVLLYAKGMLHFVFSFLPRDDSLFQFASCVSCIVLGVGLFNVGSRIKKAIPSRIVVGKMIGVLGWVFVLFTPYVFLTNDKDRISASFFFIAIGAVIIVFGMFICSGVLGNIVGVLVKCMAPQKFGKFLLSGIRCIRRSFKRIEEATRP